VAALVQPPVQGIGYKIPNKRKIFPLFIEFDFLLKKICKGTILNYYFPGV
jgi:hypothetical protein